MSLPHQQHMLLLTFLISEIHSETRHNKYKIEGGEGDRVAILLTLSQTSPGFYVSAVQSFENTAGKGEIVLNEKFLLFPVFSTCLENFLLFSSNLRLSSANSFSLEETKICCVRKG